MENRIHFLGFHCLPTLPSLTPTPYLNVIKVFPAIGWHTQIHVQQVLHLQCVQNKLVIGEVEAITLSLNSSDSDLLIGIVVTSPDSTPIYL